MKLGFYKDPWGLSGFRVKVLSDRDGLASHFGEYIRDAGDGKACFTVFETQTALSVGELKLGFRQQQMRFELLSAAPGRRVIEPAAAATTERAFLESLHGCRAILAVGPAKLPGVPFFSRDSGTTGRCGLCRPEYGCLRLN